VDASALIVAIGNQKRRRPQNLEKSKSLLLMLAITFDYAYPNETKPTKVKVGWNHCPGRQYFPEKSISSGQWSQATVES
jgi:hypothetical protein